METYLKKEVLDLTPTPQLLQILGDLKFKGWQCIAELVDNSIDAILSSKDIDLERKKIIVGVPTLSKIRSEEPLTIEDFADGMDEVMLEHAVKAGYSGKNTRNSIGLFGIGFNVATACLANTVEVWTSRPEMDKEIGVIIDLQEMARNKSFLRQKLVRAKRYGKIAGTEIKIYNFKREAESLLRIRDILDNIRRAYTYRLINEIGIKIIINNTEIKPFKFCSWSDKVSVRIKYDDIPAYIEIDTLLKKEYFCESCFEWIGGVIETSLQIECPICHNSDHVVKKDVQIIGWLGVQRYPDPTHYGIDISRNGRILKKLDKSLFYWNDDRAKDDSRFNPEYPRDNELYNGRLIGQIEANFIMPKYTKDDFNANDNNWRLAVNYLRGEMPLQTDLGEAFGYKGLNRSPLGNLFRAYRRIDPPGKKTLMFAKNDGSGKSDPVRQRFWKDKFYEEDPIYVDEKAWLDEIEKGELRTSPTPSVNPIHLPGGTINVTSPSGRANPTDGGTPYLAIKEIEKFPGKVLLKKTLRYDLEKVLDEKPIELTLFDYFPKNTVSRPIIIEPSGSAMKFGVYLNNYHPMFTDFADGYEDLIFMEVSSIYYSLMTKKDEWTLTRIYYELKLKYAPESMLSVSNLVSRANKLMREIQNRLLMGEGFQLDKKPNLDDLEIKAIKIKYLEQEKVVLYDIAPLLENTKFLNYLDLLYLFKFIKEFPGLIFDGNILKLPYSTIDDIELRNNELNKYLGYFNDVQWFMSTLNNIGDEAVKRLKSQIIRNRISIEILDGSISR